jgi:hypothetical protein
MADTETVEKAEVEQTEETTQEETKVEETQEEPFDKERAMATIKNLRKFEKDATKLTKELEAYKLKEAADKLADLSEIDRLKIEAQEAKEKLAELTLKEQRREAAKAAELPDAFVDRIKGETLEEMIEDAKAMVAVLPAQKQKSNIGVTNPGNNASGNQETTAERLRRLGY